MQGSPSLIHTLNICFNYLGDEAVYTPQEGSSFKIKAIFKQPDRSIAFGETRLCSETAVFDILVSEVPHPQAGDVLTLDGKSFVIQGIPLRDGKGLIWTVDTAPQ